MMGIEFHHHWLKGRALGDPQRARRLFASRSLPRDGRQIRAARARSAELTAVASIGLCLPVRCRSLYARYLARGGPNSWGVRRTEGRIVDV